MTANDLVTVKTLQNTTKDLSFSQREKHLIGLAVTLTAGCTACSNRRFKEALDDGITKEELIELTDFVALTNAGVVSKTAILSWDDETSSKCTDGSCSVK